MPRSNSDASAYYAAPQNGLFDRIWTDIEQRKGQRVTVTANSGEKHLEKLVELLWTGVRGGKTLWLWRIDVDDYLNPLQVIVLWNRHIPDVELCQRQLAALIAIIGRDNDHDTCPWCYFTPGWGHGKGCIRAACADIIPVRPRTRRSDR